MSRHFVAIRIFKFVINSIILMGRFLYDEFLSTCFFSTSSLIDERRISFAILHTYIYLHMYVRSFFFFFSPRPAAVRRTVVICRVRACENTTEEYFTFRSVHARPDDSVAVPRHEAFISKYVYRCVQGPGSSLNKCRSIYKGSKMRMFLLSPFYPIPHPSPFCSSHSFSLFLPFRVPLARRKIHAAKSYVEKRR